MKRMSDQISQAMSFAGLLRIIRTRAEHGGLTIDHLVELVGPKGHAFLSVFLIIPFLQPIPLPGISTVVGLVIALAGFRMALMKPTWVPQRFAKVSLEKGILLRICTVFEQIMTRLERWIEPRGQMFLRANWVHRINGALLSFHGLVLSLPLPIPFSNFLPALTIFLIALGCLEEDLALVTAGYAAVVVNAGFFVALVLVPYLSIRFLS